MGSAASFVSETEAAMGTGAATVVVAMAVVVVVVVVAVGAVAGAVSSFGKDKESSLNGSLFQLCE